MKKINVTIEELLSVYYKEGEAASLPQTNPAGVPSMSRIAEGLRSGFSNEERTAIQNSDWAQRMITTAWREVPPAIGIYMDYHTGKDQTFKSAVEMLTVISPREATRFRDAADLVSDVLQSTALPEAYFAMAAAGGQKPWSYDRTSGNLTLCLSTGDDPNDPLTIRVTSTDPADGGLLPRVMLEVTESGKQLAFDTLPALAPRKPIGAKETVIQSVWLSPETFREAIGNFSSKPFIATVWLEPKVEETPEA